MATLRSHQRAAQDLRRRLAANLRAQRERLGLTQERAAERVGFSLQYYQRIERQIVNVPLDTVARCALAFSVDPQELMEPVGVRPAKPQARTH